MSRRFNLLPLLPSGPDGIQRELAARDLPLGAVYGGCGLRFRRNGYFCILLLSFARPAHNVSTASTSMFTLYPVPGFGIAC